MGKDLKENKGFFLWPSWDIDNSVLVHGELDKDTMKVVKDLTSKVANKRVPMTVQDLVPMLIDQDGSCDFDGFMLNVAASLIDDILGTTLESLSDDMVKRTLEYDDIPEGSKDGEMAKAIEGLTTALKGLLDDKKSNKKKGDKLNSTLLTAIAEEEDDATETPPLKKKKEETAKPSIIVVQEETKNNLDGTTPVVLVEKKKKMRKKKIPIASTHHDLCHMPAREDCEHCGKGKLVRKPAMRIAEEDKDPSREPKEFGERIHADLVGPTDPI